MKVPNANGARNLPGIVRGRHYTVPLVHGTASVRDVCMLSGTTLNFVGVVDGTVPRITQVISNH